MKCAIKLAVILAAILALSTFTTLSVGKDLSAPVAKLSQWIEAASKE